MSCDCTRRNLCFQAAELFRRTVRTMADYILLDTFESRRPWLEAERAYRKHLREAKRLARAS